LGHGVHTTTCYLFKGNDVRLLRMVKSFAARQKAEVVAERSQYDGNALQWHVLEQPRFLEVFCIARRSQANMVLRQVSAQTNVESTVTSYIMTSTL